MFYHHGLDPQIGAEPIGVIESIKADAIGLWAEAQIDRAHRYAAAILDLIKQGALGWSSGTLPYLMRKAADGAITRWYIVEGSVTPEPCEPRHTQVSVKSLAAVSAAYKSLALSTQPLMQELTLDEITTSFSLEPTALDGLKSIVQQAVADAVRDALKTEMPRKRLPFPVEENGTKAAESLRIEVTRATKYSPMSAEDMSFLAEIAPSISGLRLPETFYRELADKSVKAVNSGRLGMEAVEGLVRTYGASFKANELSTIGQSGFGAEWAADSWRAEIWAKVRQDNVMAQVLPMIEMPTNPWELPIESTDPTVYFVPETTDQTQLVYGTGNPITQTKAGTGKQTMNAKKLALRLAWSSELNEDSILPVVTQYRAQAVRALQNAIDNVILNGDTATAANTNINLIDGTPTAGTKYLAFDGIRKYCLVTNALQRFDGAGAPTMPTLRKGRFLLRGDYALRHRDCAWIVDDQAYGKLLSVDEFSTLDKAGAAATNLTGQIGMMDGVPVFASAELGLSRTADGKISATPVNNTKGQAIIVFKPNWLIGYRRQVQAALEYVSFADAYHLTVTARVCLASFDTQSAAAIFDLTV